MKRMPTKWIQKGLTLIEVMFAAAVLGVVVLGATSFQQIVIRTTQNTGDRVFAAQKAVQIFEELRAFVQANQEDALNSLQSYNDVTYSPILTAERITNPADPLSKNVVLSQANNTWKYVRKITVTDIPNDANAKSVTVSIFYGDPNDVNAIHGNKPLATTSGILKTNIGKSPPTQVYDMYVIALESVPAWWADISTIRPIYENTMIDMGNRNPGLEFRKHVISRMSYGRDPFYMPYINTAGEVGAQALPWIYLYPGKIQFNTTTKANEYYVEQNILGRKRTDGPSTTQDGGSIYSPYKPNSQRIGTNAIYTPTNGHINKHRDYAIADSFNYAVRYHEEVAMQTRLLAELDRQIAATSDLQSKNILLEKKRLASEPSLRMLLEEMNSNPDKYLNAMIVNLHAELVPVPPIRNYSDPAKKVGFADDGTVSNNEINYYRHKRVVTHPERIHYENDQRANIQLRVHPFEVIPPGTNTLPTSVDFTENPTQDTLDTITLFVPTDGPGRSPYNPDEPGFLSNPNISDPHNNIGLEFNRVIGNPSGGNTPNAVPYKWRRASGSNFMKITNSDIIVPGQDNSAVQLLGQIHSVNGTGTDPYIDIIRDDNAIDGVSKAFSSTGSISTLCEQICNERFIIGGRNSEYAHRRIVRVRSIDSPALTSPNRWRIRLYPGENTANAFNRAIPENVGYLMTRHRDYHVTHNPTVYGTTRNGILITLFNTPTRHQANGTSGGGLHTNRRLYGMEYIPAPVRNPNEGSNYTFEFGKEDLTSTTSSNANAKNTARWRILLNAGSRNELQNRVMTVETRIGPRIYDVRAIGGNLPPGFTYNANADVSMRPQVLEASLEEGLNGDGDIYRPNSPTGVEHDTIPRPFPHNVSRTYVHIGGVGVPTTEFNQFLGDPRLMPYADIKAIHGYNWFAYSNKCDSNKDSFANDCSAPGNGDEAGGGYSHYNRKKNLGWSSVEGDMNRLFALYTDGIMKSKSIYNSISGYSSYYYGIGGEIGTDSNNTTFPIRRTPFQTSSSTSTFDSTDNTNVNVFNSGNDRYIQSTSGSFRWFANAWMGELFPDEADRFWLENGNLPTQDYAATHAATDSTWPSSLNTRFYRISYNDNAAYFGSNDYSNTGAGARPLATRRKATANDGSAAFMNGNSLGSGSNRLNHISRGNTDLAQLTFGTNDAGRYLIDSFNLSMPGLLAAARPFKVDAGTFSGNGYGDAEISNKRNRIHHLNVKTGQTSGSASSENVYYRQQADNSETASGILKLTRPSNTDLTGYVLINGLSPSRDDGPAILARLAQGSMMQAFLAGGDFTGSKTTASASGRIVQLPRLEISYPKAGASLKADTPALNVTAKLAWRRWDGQKYTNSYNDDWHESMNLRLQLKYSLDDGRTWYFVGDGNATRYDRLSNGIFYPQHEWGTQTPLLVAEQERGGPAWNVSAWTQVQEKTPVLIRLECFRAGYENQGYSYHEVRVTMGNL